MPELRRDASPWVHRIIQLLADGEWHDFESIVQTAMEMVPPGLATRTAEANRVSTSKRPGRDAPPEQRTKNTDLAHIIRIGARHEVVQAINSLRRNGRVEVFPLRKIEGVPKRMRLGDGQRVAPRKRKSPWEVVRRGNAGRESDTNTSSE